MRHFLQAAAVPLQLPHGICSRFNLLALPALAAMKSLAVVTAAGSKLQDVPMAELVKMCKGTQKAWSDGRSFTLVMKDPEAPEMHVAVQKLFGMAPGDLKASIAKLNESRQVLRVVDSDEELLRTVEATPGAAGQAGEVRNGCRRMTSR